MLKRKLVLIVLASMITIPLLLAAYETISAATCWHPFRLLANWWISGVTVFISIALALENLQSYSRPGSGDFAGLV